MVQCRCDVRSHPCSNTLLRQYCQLVAIFGGGYYAYVTSKFANRLIVLDYDPNNDGNVDDAVIAGAVLLANDHVAKDDKIIGNKGQGGQGVLPVPNVYNGWVQQLPIGYKAQLTTEQRNPIGPRNPHDDH
jgi:hypothetical protein